MKRSYYFALAVGLLLLALVLLVYQGLRNDRGGSGQREVKQDSVSQNPKNPSGSLVVRKSAGTPMAKDSDALERIRTLVSVKDMGGLLRVVGTFEANEFPEVWALLSSLPDQPFVNELIRVRLSLNALTDSDLNQEKVRIKG